MNGPAIGSDHSPLVLMLEHNDFKGRKRFRFEDMWLEKEECYELIRNAWKGSEPCRGVADLKPKFERCITTLTEWSKTEFKNNLIKIRKVKQILREMGD